MQKMFQTYISLTENKITLRLVTVLNLDNKKKKLKITKPA